MSDSAVKVAVRIRPLVNRELARGDRTVTNVDEIENQLTIGGKAAFTFDHVFDCNTPQSSVYEACVGGLVEGTFEGYNATILAYGQTGSGKTHTMGTGMDLTGHIPDDELGIVPRAVKHIFDGIEERKREAEQKGILPPTFEVSVTFVELYNENIFDLLENERDRNKIKIYEEPGTNEIQLHGVKMATVKSPGELMEILRLGALNRTTGATNMNEQSSRSHAIFSIYIKQQRPCQLPDDMAAANTTTDFEFLSAKFHFVDLAGSERVAKTGATGARAKEGCNINMGLLMLGNVIKALADKEQANYRSSKLTRLLKDSLGGNSRTLMIACASPSESDFVETYNTMQYANRTKNIKNKVVANQDKSSRLISDLRRRIAELEGELLEFKTGKKTFNADGAVISTDADIENSALLAEVNKLTTKVKALQDALEQSKNRNTALQRQNLQDLAAAHNGGIGEAGEDTIVSMAEKYFEEIEVLRNDLTEAHSTIDDLRKQVSRLKQALTSRSPHVAASFTNDTNNASQVSEVSDLLAHIQKDLEEKKKRYEEVEAIALKRVLPEKRSSSAASSEGDEHSNETSGDDNMDEEMSEDEEEIIASEEKERLCDELTQLQDDINVKMQLVSTLEQGEQRILQIKAEYEKKMANLLERIQQTEKERNEMLEKLSVKSGKGQDKEVEKKIKEVKAQYEEKLNGLKQEFKKFKDMERNHQRMIEQQKRQQQDLEKYRREVEAMKKSKVDLMKRINSEAKIIKEREKAQERKLTAMTKEARKRDMKIQLLERKEQQREEFLKRQNEDLARKLKQQEMNYKINAIKAPPSIAATPKSSKVRTPRTRLNWEIVEKGINKQVTQRQMYEQLKEQFESKVAERQKLDRDVADLEKSFIKLHDPTQRQDVDVQIQSIREKTEYLNSEINEIQQEIVGTDPDDDFAAPGANTSLEKAIDNCKNLDDAKLLCKRLIQLTIDKTLTAVKAEQSVKVLNAEIEDMKKNYVEAGDIVHSFMCEKDEDFNNLTYIENKPVSNKNKARRITGTTQDFLFAGRREAAPKNLIKIEEDDTQLPFSFDVLKEVNGQSRPYEADAESLCSSVSENVKQEKTEKTQVFRRYEANNVVKYNNVLSAHANSIYSLSCNDEILISGSKDRLALVFDINTQQIKRTLKGHPSSVRVVKVIPQSNYVVTASVYQIRLWDTRTEECVQLFQSSGIVTDNIVEDGRRNAAIPIGEDEIFALDTDPTGQWMYSNFKGGLRCWDLHKRSSFGRLAGDDNMPITSIAVQPAEDATGRLEVFCGQRGLKGNNSGKVSLYSTNVGTCKASYQEIKINSPVTDIIPDGKTFFVGTNVGEVFRYSSVDFKREDINARTSNTQLNKLCFVRSIKGNGTLLAAGYDDGIIKYFEYEGRQSFKREGMMNNANTKVTAMSANSKQLYFSTGKDIAVYDVVYNPLI